MFTKIEKGKKKKKKKKHKRTKKDKMHKPKKILNNNFHIVMDMPKSNPQNGHAVQ